MLFRLFKYIKVQQQALQNDWYHPFIPAIVCYYWVIRGKNENEF